MKYYTYQVSVGKELTVVELLNHSKDFLALRRENEFDIFCLTRELTIRRKGKSLKEVRPIFPGYIFIHCEKLLPQVNHYLRKNQHIFRCLPSWTTPEPLNCAVSARSLQDLKVVKHFHGFGSTLRSSLVKFDENQRITVVEGPLKGMEGMIIRVDKRKRRAKVKLDLYATSYQIDLAFEFITGGTHAQ